MRGIVIGGTGKINVIHYEEHVTERLLNNKGTNIDTWGTSKSISS